ncbi:MAG: RNA-binding protein [Planctomycetaceae bacterium]|nr:RNA-binding protein [Planctomycetaceae bacterium]
MNGAQDETIQLDQFLKWVGAVGTGGEAKRVIQAGRVRVNDQRETRRRRKLSPNDVVVLGERSFVVQFDGPPGESG